MTEDESQFIQELRDYLERVALGPVMERLGVDAKMPDLLRAVQELQGREEARRGYPLPQLPSPEHAVRDPMADLEARVERLERGWATAPRSVARPPEQFAGEEALKHAVVVACFDTGGNAWTDFETDLECARYCSANRCDANGANVDATSLIYIHFPVTPVAEHGGDTTTYTGVTMCPVGTVIPYLDEQGTTIATIAMHGREAGWLRYLQWVFTVPTGSAIWCGDDAGAGIRSFLTGISVPANSKHQLQFSWRNVTRDRWGRWVTETELTYATIALDVLQNGPDSHICTFTVISGPTTTP